jgi:6-phosphogluconate dehydrogenase
VEFIVDAAGQKGTGLWTVESALNMGVPVPTIYAALNARVLSSLRPERLAAEPLLSSPGGPAFDLGQPATGMAPLRDACILACIASYAQGMALMQEASKLHEYQLNFPEIGRIWKGGCIIRARLLQRIQDAYVARADLANLMLDPWFLEQVKRRLPGLRQVVAGAALAGIPVPCLSSTLDYIQSYFSGRLPQNLVQAMRDCFGSHTYERTDQPGAFHTEWLS